MQSTFPSESEHAGTIMSQWQGIIAQVESSMETRPTPAGFENCCNNINGGRIFSANYQESRLATKGLTLGAPVPRDQVL